MLTNLCDWGQGLMREIGISGTLIWYYYICQREVWLIAHQLTPDQDDANLLLGKYINDTAYDRERKELVIGSSKIDIYRFEDNGLVVSEVKKSSKYRKSARMQLAFYLKELATKGIRARGELRFPLEKAREPLILDRDTVKELRRAERDILRILYPEKPPSPTKNPFCKKCAYAEFCWI